MNNQKLELLRLNYFQNDEPVPYELKCGTIINLYPVKVAKYSLYETVQDIMNVDKNSINDINVIQMNYLDFIADVLLKEDRDSTIYSVAEYFDLVTHKNVFIDTDENNKYAIFLVDKEEGVITDKISAKELDEIIKIVNCQNDPYYDDRDVSNDVKEAYEEWARLKYKDGHNPSLESKKNYVISKTGMLMQQINDMTYRSFIQVWRSCIDDTMYIADKIIQGSFKYKSDREIKHPQFVKPVDKYEEMFGGDAQQFENKISQING